MTDGASTPGVAVVIPAFNAAATIRETLDGVAAQTLRPREVVVVDDGSTDDTVAIARAYEVAVISGPNRGAASARNVGIAATSAPWVAFVDADDVWLPDKLERQAAHFATSPMSYTDAWIVDGDSAVTVSSHAQCPSGSILESLLLNNVITLSTVVVRRDVLVEAGGFPESLKVVHDWSLWLKVAARHRIQFVDVPLVRYRVSEGGISRDVRVTRPELLAVVEEAFSDTGVAHGLPHLRRRALAGAYGVVAHEAARSSRWAEAAQLSLKRLSEAPSDFQAWKALVKIGLSASGVWKW